MSWEEIRGHERPEKIFRLAAQRERLASTFLFVGPEGIGKRKFARQLARALFCERFPESELQSCDECSQCQQVRAGSHPDLLELRKPDDKNNLPIGMFAGSNDCGPGLCHDLSIKPAAGGRRIAIIDDADFLRAEAANALLKTLEEPPPRSLLILLGTSEQQQLPTILSRCQIVRFAPLPAVDLRAILEGLALGEGTPLELLVPASSGSVQQAILLHPPEVFAFRRELLGQLATLNPLRGDFLQTLLGFLGEKETEAAAKRAKLRFIADLTLEFYGLLLQTISGLNPPIPDAIAAEALEQAAAEWNAPAVQLASMIERTESMSSQIEMYLNSANLLGPWLADLSNLAHGRSLVAVEF